VGAGEFEIAATLTRSLTAAALVDVAAIAMPFELRFGNVGDDVLFEFAGGFKIGTAAMRALLGMNIVLDEDGPWRWLGAKDAGMLAMLLAPPILGSSLSGRPLIGGALAALEKCLHLMFELRNPSPQLSVFRFEFGNPLITRVVHDPHSLPEMPISGKSSCLTFTVDDFGDAKAAATRQTDDDQSLRPVFRDDSPFAWASAKTAANSRRVRKRVGSRFQVGCMAGSGIGASEVLARESTCISEFS